MSLYEEIPRLGEPVVRVEVGEGIVSGHHTSHDGSIENRSGADELERQFLLGFFGYIKREACHFVPFEECDTGQEEEKRIDDRKCWKEKMKVLIFDDEDECRDDEDEYA